MLDLLGCDYGSPTIRASGWKSLRLRFLKQNGKCEVCGTRNKKKLQVHHVKPYHLYPELELYWINLRTLCIPHHLLVGHLMLWSSWNPQIDEMIEMIKSAIGNRPRSGLGLELGLLRSYYEWHEASGQA